MSEPKSERAPATDPPHSVEEYDRAVDRLLPNFRFPGSLRTFARRIRFHLADADEETLLLADAARVRMLKILTDQHVPEERATSAVAEALDAAADFQLENLRRLDNLADHKREEHAVLYLILGLVRLSAAVSKLPPSYKNIFNAVLAHCPLDSFDTEVFSALITAVRETALRHNSECRVREVLDALLEPIMCAGPFDLVDLWETLPADAKGAIERNLPQFGSGTDLERFLARIGAILSEADHASRSGRPRSLIRPFVARVGRLWRAIGLNVGRANDPDGTVLAGRFQQFCDAALAGVGDSTRITDNDVRTEQRSVKRSSRPGLEGTAKKNAR